MNRNDCWHFTWRQCHITSGELVWLHQAADNTPDLPLLIADCRHTIFGHIHHLPEDTLAHIVLNHIIGVLTGTQPISGWKCPVGCPQKTWLQQVNAHSLTASPDQHLTRPAHVGIHLAADVSWSREMLVRWSSEWVRVSLR